jgi:hypothetical protein
VAIPLRSFISRAISGKVSFPLPFHSFSISVHLALGEGN